MRSRYVKRRSYRRKPSRRPARRSYRAKKRTYRKSPSMSKKRILNITATKKRNTMLTFSNTTSTGTIVAPTNQPLTLNGNSTGRVLWTATAQTIKASPFPIYEGVRTATSCYMVGLSEHLKLQTGSPLPWYHRRICFTTKGAGLTVQQPGDSPTVPYQTYFDGTSTGVERLMFNQTAGGGLGNTVSATDGVIFKGVQNTDWNDVILAPVDTRRITVKFDKTWCLKSGNQNGTVYERKLYHPMKKTLIYDDDEQGASETPAFFSVDSKAGMGDYYVYDIYAPGIQGQSSDQLTVYANTTLYWHEK